MATVLNAIRELYARWPLARGEDSLRDSALYDLYEENLAMMAARSLILLAFSFAQAAPKRDRGHATEATVDMKERKSGEFVARYTMPGAEVLLESLPEVKVGGTDVADFDEGNDQYKDHIVMMIELVNLEGGSILITA